jgi:hypothetical protein
MRADVRDWQQLLVANRLANSVANGHPFIQHEIVVDNIKCVIDLRLGRLSRSVVSLTSSDWGIVNWGIVNWGIVNWGIVMGIGRYKSAKVVGRRLSGSFFVVAR